MRVAASLFIHLIWTLIRLLRPDGARSVVAETLLIRHQLMILNRSRKRAPALRPTDRVIAGLLAAIIRPARLVRSAIVLKPSTIMSFHRALVQRKYRLLYQGPSWLSFLGHTKDSLWSLDFFRCESLILKSHWVMVVMDHYTRRIVGLAVHAGPLDGPAICRMFGRIVRQASVIPRSLSSDHDPLFEFHRWKANLRILEIHEIKTVPDVPLSHPFVERLIGTIRREFLDHAPFWTSADLEQKLETFRHYYNHARTHGSLDGATPLLSRRPRGTLHAIKWRTHCRGLYELAVSA